MELLFYLLDSHPTHPLVNSYILTNKAGDLVGLLGLDSSDSLLHQVATLHIQIQCSIFSLDFPRGDHLKHSLH